MGRVTILLRAHQDVLIRLYFARIDPSIAFRLAVSLPLSAP
jgi:hypothetical protein